MSTQTPQSCETLLQAMVAFDTVNTNVSGRPFPERGLMEFLESQGSALGLDATRFPVGDSDFNLLLSCRGNSGAPWLVFESHLDTVSVDGMAIEPFAGRIRDGRIYGRGACDTKGSGAAMLWALRRYAERADRPNNIAILYTLDEEIGKTGVRGFVARHLPSLRFRPAGVIVGEATLLRPVVAHHGVVRWAIQTQGIAAHSADPSKGRSAISMMVKVIELLESRYIPSLAASHPLTGKAQCSINVIRGGVQINVIPESCEIQIDRRVVPGEDVNSVLPAVEALLDEPRRQDPHMKVAQQVLFIDPPLDPRGSEAFIDIVGQVLRQMDMPWQSTGVSYATDASTFAEVGIPAVVLGPGDIAQAHSCDEWLELDQLHRAVEVYLRLMSSPLDEIAATS
jgi:acetylornithine deacetylase